MVQRIECKSLTGRVEYGAPLQVEEVKTAGDAFSVEGYVSTWGGVDKVGDVVMPTAFDSTLASGKKTLFLYAHDLRQMLGVPVVLRKDDHGLFGRFKISKTALGETVHTLMEDGAPFGFSIGFITKNADYDEQGMRRLHDVDLLENSLAPLPLIANPEAQVTAFKTLLGLDDWEQRSGLSLPSSPITKVQFDALTETEKLTLYYELVDAGVLSL